MRIKRNPLDILFSKLIRTQRPECEICKRNPSSQIHHFKGRRYQSVRYDPQNVWAVCFACHRKFEEDPPWAVSQMQKRLGLKYDQWVLMANMICKRYDDDKAALKLWMERELKKLS